MNARSFHALLLSACIVMLSACATAPPECNCDEAQQADGPADDEASAIEMADFDIPVVPLTRQEELGLGPSDAPVRIYIYLDIACPYSKDAWQSIAAIVEENAPDVRVTIRHFPVKSGSDAAQMRLEAAARVDQSKAIALLESLLQDPPSGMGFLFGDRSADQVIADNIIRAQLDQRALETLVEEAQLQHVVTSDAEEARRLGFTGTPGIVVNGVRVYGAVPKETFQLLVDQFKSPQSAEARHP